LFQGSFSQNTEPNAINKNGGVNFVKIMVPFVSRQSNCKSPFAHSFVTGLEHAIVAKLHDPSCCRALQKNTSLQL
jgi:hypothetical protein